MYLYVGNGFGIGMVIITIIVNYMFCYFPPSFFALLCFSFCFFFCCSKYFTQICLGLFVCFVCLYFCIFVCYHKTRKSFRRLLPWPRSKHPGSTFTRVAQFFLQSYQRYTTALVCLIVHVRVCVFCWLEQNPQNYTPFLCEKGSKPPGSDHTRAAEQTTCITKTAVKTTYVSIYG